MGSVQDLIQLAEFKLGQQQRTPDRISSFLQSVNKTVEEATTRRRKRENQNRLSSMLLKDTGKYDAEYTVGDTGAISIKYKPKKPVFSTAVKDASKRIAAGEDFDAVTGDLQINFPTNYKDTTEKFLRKSLPQAVFKSPKFKVGKGLSAAFSKDIAKLSPITQEVIKDIENKIRTEEDFKKVVIMGKAKLQEAGVDVKAILEYFGRDEFGNKRADVWEQDL